MMGANKSVPWILAAAFGSVIILALSWLFAISPTMTAAADSSSQADDARSHNVVLQQQISKLADEFTHLDEYKATLATLHSQIPEQVDLTAINRGLQNTAVASGVTITAVNVSSPTEFVPVSAAAAAAPTAGASAAPTASSTSTAGSSGTTSAAASPGVAGFYAVPVSVILVGTFDQATAYLTALQTGEGRIFLAASINATAQQATGASGGRPPLAAGDLELTITGYTYVISGTRPTAAQATTPATPPTLPVPSGQKNPFAPIQ